MGRPINDRFLGDFVAKSGFQVSAVVHVDAGEGPEPGNILRQRSNNKYLVEGVNSGEQLVCKLVADLEPALGEMSVSVFSDEKGLVTVIDAQDETDYDGAGNNGTFDGGASHSAGDILTLSNGASITVDDDAAGVVTEFTVTDGGDPVTAGSTLTQSATDGSGTDFELTIGTANDEPLPEFARNINNRTVKTFLGNIYAWPVNADITSRTDINIQGQ